MRLFKGMAPLIPAFYLECIVMNGTVHSSSILFYQWCFNFTSFSLSSGRFSTTPELSLDGGCHALCLHTLQELENPFFANIIRRPVGNQNPTPQARGVTDKRHWQ